MPVTGSPGWEAMTSAASGATSRDSSLETVHSPSARRQWLISPPRWSTSIASGSDRRRAGERVGQPPAGMEATQRSGPSSGRLDPEAAERGVQRVGHLCSLTAGSPVYAPRGYIPAVAGSSARCGDDRRARRPATHLKPLAASANTEGREVARKPICRSSDGASIISKNPTKALRKLYVMPSVHCGGIK